MKKIGGGILMAVCLVLMGAGPSTDQADYTVGDFAVRMAKMITQKADYTPETAKALLDNLGVDLDADLDGQLREETLVDTFQQLGVDLSTSSPDRSLSRQDAQRLIGLFDSLGGSTEASNGPQSIKCKSGANKGDQCITDADCPGSFCNIPPGQAKKIASPIDG